VLLQQWPDRGIHQRLVQLSKVKEPDRPEVHVIETTLEHSFIFFSSLSVYNFHILVTAHVKRMA